jgi:hypothetical protein
MTDVCVGIGFCKFRRRRIKCNHDFYVPTGFEKMRSALSSPREFAKEKLCLLDISGMRKLSGIKQAEIDRHSIMLNNRAPAATARQMSTLRHSPGLSSIRAVLRSITWTKVFNPVVQDIPVGVINLILRPCSGNKCPDHSVNKNPDTIDRDDAITVAADTADFSKGDDTPAAGAMSQLPAPIFEQVTNPLYARHLLHAAPDDDAWIELSAATRDVVAWLLMRSAARHHEESPTAEDEAPAARRHQGPSE